MTTLNIGFGSRCTEEMLQNSKVLFPFPDQHADQHKLFLNGPKRIMGRVVVVPIMLQERDSEKQKVNIQRCIEKHRYYRVIPFIRYRSEPCEARGRS